MDDSNFNPVAPDPTLSPSPEATSPSEEPSSPSPSFSSDRQSLATIHETLNTFEQEMKAVLTPENFERRFREKRRTMYSKYIEQELGSCLTADVLRQTIRDHADLLTEASKNDVFRAILLEDVMEKAGELESGPIRSAEKKLALVRDIYDAAEKVDPEQGGVTPEWAVRKRREIRGALAREIVGADENTKDVESYIAAFEQYEVNRISSEDEWRDGDAELARHLRQVMREKERGELPVAEAEPEEETPRPSVFTTPPSQPVVTKPVIPEPTVSPVAPVSPAPEVMAPVSPMQSESTHTQTPVKPVERKRPEDIVRSSMSGATRRVQNINPGPVGTFFAGVLEGRVEAGTSSQMRESSPEVDDTSHSTMPATPVSEPTIAPDVVTSKEESSDETIEQTLRAAIDQIRRDQEEGTPAPDITNHTGQPIDSAVSSSSSEVDSLQQSLNEQGVDQERPVEKKKGFFGKLFGR